MTQYGVKFNTVVIILFKAYRGSTTSKSNPE